MNISSAFESVKSFFKNQPNRVRTPAILQMEAVECGAASLAIILAYYGRIVPLAELRSECGVSRDGSKASKVLKAARFYGLEAKGFKKSLQDLKNYKPPYIVFWNFNHFLVVEGFAQDYVYLSDPATGRRKITWNEFDQAYTGVVLFMEPGSQFKKGGRKKSIMAALASRLQTSQTAIIFCLIAGVVLTIPRLAVPAFSQVFVDEILVANRQEWLRPMLWAMLFTALTQGLLARMRFVYLRRLMVKLSVAMSGNFLWHTLRLPIGFYAQRFTGEISSRNELNDKVAEVLSGSLATTIIDSLMIIFYALIMSVYDWQLTLLAIFFAALNFFALQTLSRSRVDANMRVAQETGKVAGVAIGGIQSIETIKASGLESDLFAKFGGYYAKMLNAQQELGLPSQILSNLPVFLTSLATTSILVVGGFKVMGGGLSIGMLVAYQTLTQEFLTPVNNLVNFGSTLQELEADLNRLDDVLENPLDPESERTVSKEIDNQGFIIQKDSFQLQGYVELQNVNFGYSSLEPPLIENLNLTIRPGQRVAFVGGSGSGKSTVAKLVTGLYPVWDGKILLDGTPRNQIPRSILANSLAMVEQDIFVFAGTVRENLTLWDPTVPEEDIMRACQDAVIHDLILNMPGGYDTQLAEGGANMSGGQRQRLEIARALVRNPAILVLDEATSALDAETELIIDRNLRRRGCSCIVVAHRLSTIRDCDEIIVLERGKVIQRGTHEELRHQGGGYARLIRSEEA
ncbi:NHLP family bacteriocin export ABC transporter peptidase/permease/ATPase subunit [Mastigocoleus testarum]|uniref:NHLP family bacteriocin export ABC transporter peptidase/permease/ATPase subunit n=1 Tax=Mastigocoleus testarum BC008 TaxID=371196 RepID=A0A0V7ZEP7_9CYAN|nr:NHLP family bacteriocin export ABC transporter peptidase/permease/ATPase subunit [Mastigocoleus testarum]KST62925.1 NHLP family bacteriocin export ABC transporter peptidase/permease/ATPase subunit [Mastigocoleus testarum BC008]KST63016.1 NHLP family bacteriocin export ABC transporter peptidase/permease/ATPase subunit [Mastigocoleus testarum BC008]